MGRFQNAEEINNLLFEVSVPNSNTKNRVYLRDFAEVIDGAENQRIYVLLNGKESVKVRVQKQPDANTVSVVDSVKKRLEELQKSGLIPQEATLTPTLDESKFIRNSLTDVTNAAVSGALLAAAAVLLFLGSLRQAFIISLSIFSVPLIFFISLLLFKCFFLFCVFFVELIKKL